MLCFKIFKCVYFFDFFLESLVVVDEDDDDLALLSAFLPVLPSSPLPSSAFFCFSSLVRVLLYLVLRTKRKRVMLNFFYKKKYIYIFFQQNIQCYVFSASSFSANKSTCSANVELGPREARRPSRLSSNCTNASSSYFKYFCQRCRSVTCRSKCLLNKSRPAFSAAARARRSAINCQRETRMVIC